MGGRGPAPVPVGPFPPKQLAHCISVVTQIP